MLEKLPNQEDVLVHREWQHGSESFCLIGRKSFWGHKVKRYTPSVGQSDEGIVRLKFFFFFHFSSSLGNPGIVELYSQNKA